MRQSVELTWAGKNKTEEKHEACFREIERVQVNPFWGTGDYYEQVEEPSALPNETDNIYCYGDNLIFLQNVSQWAGADKIDLIYIDPPYMTDIAYSSSITVGSSASETTIQRPAFHDRWAQGLNSYLDMLYPRLQMMKNSLSPQGSIIVHVDWHTNHYVRMLLDEIFGRENFVNDIAWCFGGGGNSRRHFHRKHDSILWYALSSDYVFNPQFRPYTSGTMERGLTNVKGDRYRLHEEGALMQDWWTDINKILSPTAYENLKYPTQKPKELIKRLVAAASQPGSRVADFFAGSGTLAEVCNEMGRKWVLCDSSPLALQTSVYRLIKTGSSPFKIISTDYMVNDAQENKLILKKPRVSKMDHNHFLIDLGIEIYQPAHISEPFEGGSFTDYIEFWEIDLDYNQSFKSCCQVLRSQRYKGPLASNMLLKLETGLPRHIAVKVWDVWANQTTAIMELNPV